MGYVFLGVFAALPYLILFALGAAVLCVFGVKLRTALVASGAMWYNRHPVFIIPEECAAYVDRDILRDSLCSRRFGKMTLYIRVVGATGTSLCAEAVYFPFFDSLGCAREYNADTGRWIGEYYEP